MGLDTYARNGDKSELTKEQYEAFENAHIQLCAGMFSSGGNHGSFRGKVYAKELKSITGVDLYQEWIDPDTVYEMALELHAYVQELQQLDKFFTVCLEEDLGLAGWW